MAVLAGGSSKRPGDPATSMGLVLLVDDEKVVLRIGRRALERAGFQVATASDGAEALAALERFGSDLRAVVLDLELPRLDGRQILDRIHQQRPDLPIVIASGLDEPPTAIDPEPVAAGRPSLLPKPYLPSELVARVRALME